MARMDWERKDLRREARWHGRQATTAIDLFLLHQEQVTAWRTLGDGDAERMAYWQTIADRHAEAAAEWARKAAHKARLSLAVLR